MTDKITIERDILELAAKAAGIEVHDWLPGSLGFALGQSGKFLKARWNPLADDGDALRLAVRLNLKHVFHPALNQAIVRPYYASDLEWVENVEKHPDPYAATRRAIVRAAAEIGRAA